LNWTLTELKKSVLLISKQDRWLKTLSRSSLESSGGRPISLLFQNCWIRFLDQNFLNLRIRSCSDSGCHRSNWEFTRGGRSYFFRLRPRSCCKIFESGSGNF